MLMLVIMLASLPTSASQLLPRSCETPEILKRIKTSAVPIAPTRLHSISSDKLPSEELKTGISVTHVRPRDVAEHVGLAATTGAGAGAAQPVEQDIGFFPVIPPNSQLVPDQLEIRGFLAHREASVNGLTQRARTSRAPSPRVEVAELIQTGLLPTDDLQSAVITTLAPGFDTPLSFRAPIRRAEELPWWKFTSCRKRTGPYSMPCSPRSLAGVRLPKIAVPTRTSVAPSSIATGKSPLIPIESCGRVA